MGNYTDTYGVFPMRKEEEYGIMYSGVEQELKMFVMVSILFIFGKIYLPVESYYKRLRYG